MTLNRSFLECREQVANRTEPFIGNRRHWRWTCQLIRDTREGVFVDREERDRMDYLMLVIPRRYFFNDE